MTPKKLLSLAKKAWYKAHKRQPTSLLPAAALYIPEKGVCFATILDRGRKDKSREEVQSLPDLDNLVGQRTTEFAKSSQQLFHAEDTGMLYAFQNRGSGYGSKVPAGFILVTFGEAVSRGTPPNNVEPHYTK